MRFVPVKLRLADAAVFGEANERDAFEFAPSAFAISFLQVTKDPNSVADRDGLDLGRFADDLEVHALKILSCRCSSRLEPRGSAEAHPDRQ